MKKNVKAIFAGLAAAALLAGFSSCSNGSSDDPTSMPESSDIYSGGEVTFAIKAASTNAAKTNLVLQYDRSAVGAKEQINLIDAELEVKVDGTSVSMPSSIGFYLDEYSSFATKQDSAKEPDANKQKTYKCTLSLGKKLESGNTVSIQLKKARLAGEGINAVNAGSILATIVDTDEAVGYWNDRLSDTKYTAFISMKNGKDFNAKEPAPTSPETNLLSESFTLSGWNNVCIPGNKFTSEKKTIDITYSKNTSNDGNVMQLIIVQDWVKLNTARVSGNVAKDANNEDLNPWDVSNDGTISEWTFSVNLTDEEWTKVKAEGFAVQGTGATITKVVLK